MNLRLYHNSRQEFYRSPFGALPCSAKLTLRLSLHDEGERVARVWVRLWNEAETLVRMREVGSADGSRIFEAKLRAPGVPCLLWYYFTVETAERSYCYCNNDAFIGGEGRQCDSPGHSYQITVYDEAFAPPAWLREGIMYQIFVDRFYKPDKPIKKQRDYQYHVMWDDVPVFTHKDKYGKRINKDFFGGNLYGVVEKLPYLKSLGVTVLYLNPIFDAYSNHKYDTGDYEHVDEGFGGDEGFRRLINACGAAGIRVVLDGVFSHTGSDSRYFNRESTYPDVGAYQSKDSPYYSWYRFDDSPEGYDCWWGVMTLPNVNETEPSYMDYIIRGKRSIVRRWLQAGASGWRLDVADELPEQFLKELYAAAKAAKPDAAVIGEVWEDASNKISYGQQREFLLGCDMDSVMNYPLKDMLLDFLCYKLPGREFTDRLWSLYENYPRAAFYSLMNSIGTHDVPRALTILGGAPFYRTLTLLEQSLYKLPPGKLELGRARLRLAVAVQFTMPGIPCIYYGDEAGMQGMGDPFNRAGYPWGHEDAELLDFYRDIAALRSRSELLKSGCFTPIDTGNDDLFAFVRHIIDGESFDGAPGEDGIILTAINRSGDQTHTHTFDLSRFDVATLVGMTGDHVQCGADGRLELALPPLSATVLSSR